MPPRKTSKRNASSLIGKNSIRQSLQPSYQLFDKRDWIRIIKRYKKRSSINPATLKKNAPFVYNLGVSLFGDWKTTCVLPSWMRIPSNERTGTHIEYASCALSALSRRIVSGSPDFQRRGL